MTRPGRPIGPDAGRVHDQSGLARELDLLRRRAAVGTGRPTVALTDLAARVSLPRSTVHTYVTGRSLAPADVLDQIIVALGAGPAEQRDWAEAWFRVAAAVDEHRRAGRPEWASPTAMLVPRQLPPDIDRFTGRDGQLASLSAMLTEPGQPACVVLSGAAGVGKTTLAVRWARLVAGHFGDGQLYANLGGFGPGSPVEPGQVLAQFLRALGMPHDQIPAELAARTAALRSLLAQRRVLVLLDNARDADQVRPLLPGDSGCLVLVTSRNRLRGLSVRDGARRMTVNPLTDCEASGLLSTLIGAELAEREPAALLAIGGWCGGLPLALSIVGDRVRGSDEDGSATGCPLAEVVAELRELPSRLDLLATSDDPSTSLRTVFSWSYLTLPPDAARLFRLLGLHPGADLDRSAAAALMGVPEQAVSGPLDSLTNGHLLEPRRSGRYELHDLLRAYAAQLAEVTETDASRQEAMSRLLGHYIGTSITAAELIAPEDRDQQLLLSLRTTGTAGIADRAQAAAWLDAELPNLVAIADRAARCGWPKHAMDLSAVLRRYLRMSARHDEALAIHANALTASRQLSDRTGEGRVRADLGIICWQLGRYDDTIEHLGTSLAIAREVGDEITEGRGLGSLGVVYERLGRYREAAEHFERSLAIARSTGNRRTESADLNNLGAVQQRLGRYDDALRNHQQALSVAQETGNRPNEAFALLNLGETSRMVGQYSDALNYLQLALALSRTVGIREAECYALAYLGTVHRSRQHYDEAEFHQRSALHIARQTGMRALETLVLNGLGETLTSIGEAAKALECHHEARRLACEIRDRYEQARALGGLAAAHRDLCATSEARWCWAQARDIYLALGTPMPDRETRQDQRPRLNS